MKTKYDSSTGQIWQGGVLVCTIHIPGTIAGERVCRELNRGGGYDPDEIGIFWSVDDIMVVDEGALTIEQRREVLQLAKRNHDAGIGINWEVIRTYIEQV